MPLFSRDEIAEAARLVYRTMPPTPQYVWPLLSQRVGAAVWVKHENHTPTGAFKIRGGVTFIDWLKRSRPDISGIVTATRGNHGQSQAARRDGRRPQGENFVSPHEYRFSREKNAAMRARSARIDRIRL